MPFMNENTSKSRYIFHFKQIIKRSAPKDVSNSNQTSCNLLLDFPNSIQIQERSIAGEPSSQATTLDFPNKEDSTRTDGS